MTWLTPALAGIAAAIAVPALLLLYFLKLRRRTVEISSTLLWKKAIQDYQANAPFQKLRRNLLLLLQLLVLLAALLALAQPVWRSDLPPAGRIVIMIDRSASMSASDDGAPGQTRLDAAKAEGFRIVESMRDATLLGATEADEAMVIAFDSTATVVQPFTTNKGTLRSAIESIGPSDAPTRLDPALSLAGAFVQSDVVAATDSVHTDGPPVYVISDGRAGDASMARPAPGMQIEYLRTGDANSENVAITAIRASRAHDRPEDASVYIGLQSNRPEATSVDVQLSVDGFVSGVRSVDLAGASADAGPATGGVVFRLPRAEGAVVAADVLIDDDLASDNTARIVLPPARRLSVAVFTEGNLFLASALEGLALSKLDSFNPDGFPSASESGALDEYDVVILDGWAPSRAPREPRAGDSAPGLPPGNYLVFGTVPDLRGLGWSEPAGQGTPGVAVMLDWEREHPALRSVGLENLVLARHIGLRVGEGATSLATSSAGPAIAEVTHGSVRAIVAGFDVSESNWPFDVGFVVFMANAVRALGDIDGSLGSEGRSPGETVAERLPASARDVRVRGPEGFDQRPSPDPDGRVTFGPLERTGLYTLDWQGDPGPRDALVASRATRLLPVNLLDAVEADTRPLESLSLQSGDVGASNSLTGERSRRGGESMVEVWRYLIMGALALMMLEWWFYNRRMAI